jgi:signal recognition particle subunit SRP54
MDAIDVFHPERMADRILGMGDIVTLVEKAQQDFDEKQARALEEKMRKNKFDFDDFLDQIKRIEKMGSIKDIASMIPGLGKAIKDVEIKEDPFKPIKAIIQSMTEQERHNPDMIKGTRRQRIAKGSGTDIAEVNKLLKQFEEMRKMMKSAASMKNPMQMMKAARAMQQMRRR